MTEPSKIRDLVESIVAEAIDSHLRPLHDQIVDKVVATVELLSTQQAGGSSTPALRSAIGSIESAIQQTDILVALLDGTTTFCGRAALLILRGNAAVGWQARGFDNNEVIKTVTIDVSSGVIAGVVQQSAAALIAPSQFDVRFFATFGAPANDEAIVVPLIVRDKVAAVLYADSGSRPEGMDIPAIELLVRAAGSWIELHALRKAAGLPAPMPSRSTLTSTRSVAVGVSAPSSVAATTAEQAPAEAKSLSTPESSSTAERGDSPRTDQRDTVPAPVPQVASAPAPVSKSSYSVPQSSVGAEVDDEEVHRKARRFAKLLVDEIVLYNRDKVTEGKLNKDLYDRLREDIDKSRSTYDRRYGQTSAGPQDYFTQALITGLADSNAALLGGNFPG